MYVSWYKNAVKTSEPPAAIYPSRIEVILHFLVSCKRAGSLVSFVSGLKLYFGSWGIEMDSTLGLRPFTCVKTWGLAPSQQWYL